MLWMALATDVSMLDLLASIVREQRPHLAFTVLEVGALPLRGQGTEPFYKLIDLFPGSRVIGLEVEEALCDELNAKAGLGIQYFPVALGERNEERDFYITQHPMCCSLYEPNELLLRLYNNFEVAYLKSRKKVRTMSLDSFTQAHGMHPIDFIKIDIQGAELEVFRGGAETLENVLAIISEVEFIPHYVGQPLFGDVCAFLSSKGLMFHKFLGLNGSSLRPLILNNDRNFPSQHMWSDAVFVRDVQLLGFLGGEHLLKLSVLSVLYEIPDLAYFCLAQYDHQYDTCLAESFLQAVNA